MNQPKPSTDSPPQTPKVSGSESKNFDAESGKVVVTSGNSNNPGEGYGDDDDPDMTIVTEDWEEQVDPDPKEIISSPEFWKMLQKDSETFLNEDEDSYQN